MTSVDFYLSKLSSSYNDEIVSTHHLAVIGDQIIVVLSLKFPKDVVEISSILTSKQSIVEVTLAMKKVKNR